MTVRTSVRDAKGCDEKCAYHFVGMRRRINLSCFLPCVLQESRATLRRSRVFLSDGLTCLFNITTMSLRRYSILPLLDALPCIVAVISVHVLYSGPRSPPLRLPSTFWHREHGNGWLKGNGSSIGIKILTMTTTIMAAQRYCPSCLTKASPTPLFRATPRAIAPPSFLRPFHTSSPLAAVQSANAQKYKRKDSSNQLLANKKKKKTSTSYATPDLRDALQFSLVDAMRYVKPGAFFSMSTQAPNTPFLAICAPPK